MQSTAGLLQPLNNPAAGFQWNVPGIVQEEFCFQPLLSSSTATTLSFDYWDYDMNPEGSRLYNKTSKNRQLIKKSISFLIDIIPALTDNTTPVSRENDSTDNNTSAGQ